MATDMIARAMARKASGGQSAGSYVRYDAAQTLSDEQKRQARENIQAEETGTWELIEELTTTEDILAFVRDKEPDGTPYDLRAIKVVIKHPGSGNAGVFDFRCYERAEQGAIAGIVLQHDKTTYSDASYRNTVVFAAEPKLGVYNCYGLEGGQGAKMGTYAPKEGEYQTSPVSKHINRLSFFIYKNIPLEAGSSIKIYGVRA